MKRTTLFITLLVLLPATIIGQDTKDKIKSIIDSYPLENYQKSTEQFFIYSKLPDNYLKKAINKYAKGKVTKEDVLLFHYQGVGMLGASFIITEDKLYYFNNINPRPHNKIDVINLKSISGFSYKRKTDNLIILGESGNPVARLYIQTYKKKKAEILIDLLNSIVGIVTSQNKDIPIAISKSELNINLERKNADGHVYSFGKGETKEEAINNALIAATKSMLDVLKEENKKTFEDLDEKLNEFIKDYISDLQVVKDYYFGTSHNIILSSIIPKSALANAFQIKYQQEDSGGMFAEVLTDNKEELKKLEYISFYNFFESNNLLENPYDLKFNFEKPINSENYINPIRGYSHVIENKIELTLSKEYQQFFDLLLTFLELHSDEVNSNIQIRYSFTGRGEFSELQSHDINFFPDEQVIKDNNFIAFLESNVSKIGYNDNFMLKAGGYPGPSQNLIDITIFRLKSANTITLINEYIQKVLFNVGFETTFSFTDNSEEKLSDIFNLNISWETILYSKDIRSEKDNLYGEEFLSSSNEYITIAIRHKSFSQTLLQKSNKYDIMVKKISDLIIPLEFISIGGLRSVSEKNNKNQAHQSVWTSISRNYNHAASLDWPTWTRTNEETFKKIQFSGEYYLNKNYLRKINSIDVKVLSSQQIAKKFDEMKKAKISQTKEGRSNFELRTSQVICGCLKNAEYYNLNEEACDSYINSALGFNAKTTNFSQNPEASMKFDLLVSKCQ